MKKNWITIVLAVMLVAAIGCCVVLAMNGGSFTPKPTAEVAEKPTKKPTSTTNKEFSGELYVEKIEYNTKTKVYTIIGKEAKYTGREYESGASIYNYGKTVSVSLNAKTIVNGADDIPDKTTIDEVYKKFNTKISYKENEIDTINTYNMYPIHYETKSKTFENVGN